ncbi:hypothetical protein KFE98_00775 [bacterium SCSIO 12741]|nr:hypothetical protein KFE98_00775 [bacterium SCSIO 12741]
MFFNRNWNKYHFLTIALLVKALMLLFLVHYHSQSDDRFLYGWIFEHNDYHYFLLPVDNFFEHGRYEYIPGQTFSGRMPGYWFPYMVLRFIFSKAIALNLLVIGQLVLSATSVYVLARTAELILNSKRAFYFTFWIYLISTFTSVFDYQTISESFSVSAMIFFFFHLVRYLKDPKKSTLLMAGLFLAWAIFLRPFLGVNLLLIPLLILVKYRKKFLRTIVHLIIFGIPFIVFESAWVVRNYKVNDKLVLLTTGVQDYGRVYSPGWQSVRTLFYRWGGQAVYFEPGMAKWFRRDPIEEPFTFPDYVFEGVDYTYQDIQNLKERYQAIQNLESDEEFYRQDSLIHWEAQGYLKSFQEAHPFRYSVWAGVRGMKRLIFSSGSTFLPFPSFGQMNMVQKGIKLFYSFLYYLLLAGIIPGLWLLLRRKDTRFYGILIAGLCIQLVLVISYYSQYQGPRYSITIYPMYVLLLSTVFVHFDRKFKILSKSD